MEYTLLDYGADLVNQAIVNGATIVIDGFQIGYAVNPSVSGSIVSPVNPVYISDETSQLNVQLSYDPNVLGISCVLPVNADDDFDIGNVLLTSSSVLYNIDTSKKANQIIVTPGVKLSSYTAGYYILVQVANSNNNVGKTVITFSIDSINDIGSPNSIIINPPIPILALTIGYNVLVNIANTNTKSNCTVSIYGLPNVYPIVDINGYPLAPGVLQKDSICEFIFTGTSFQLSGNTSIEVTNADFTSLAPGSLIAGQVYKLTCIYNTTINSISGKPCNTYSFTPELYSFLTPTPFAFGALGKAVVKTTNKLTIWGTLSNSTTDISTQANQITVLPGIKLSNLVIGYTAIVKVANTNTGVTTLTFSNGEIQDIGTVNALLVNPTHPVASLTVGYTLVVKAGNTNTGPCTITIYELVPVDIVDIYGNPLVGGAIQNGATYELIFDGVEFVITSEPIITISVTVTNIDRTPLVPNTLVAGTTYQFSCIYADTNNNVYYFTPAPYTSSIFNIIDNTVVVDYRQMLPNSFNDVPVWQDMAISASLIYRQNIVSPRNQLRNIRDPQGRQRQQMVDTARMLGLNYYIDQLPDAGIDRLSRYIAQYYPMKGTPQFGDLMSFLENSRISVNQLWSQDYQVFYEQSELSSRNLTTIFDTPPGPFYLTSHVALDYDAEKFPISSEQNLADLFYKLAPIHLVLKYIDGAFYPIPAVIYLTGRGYTEEEIISSFGSDPVEVIYLYYEAGMMEEAVYDSVSNKPPDEAAIYTSITTIDESVYKDRSDEPENKTTIYSVPVTVDDEIFDSVSNEPQDGFALCTFIGNVDTTTYSSVSDPAPNSTGVQSLLVNMDESCYDDVGIEPPYESTLYTGLTNTDREVDVSAPDTGFRLTTGETYIVINELFSNQTLGPQADFVRKSPAWYYDDFLNLAPVGIDKVRFDYNPITGNFAGLLIEQASKNLIPDPTTIESKTLSVDYGTYTVSMLGTGSLTVSLLSSSMLVTSSTPFTFSVTSSTAVTIVPISDVDFMQLEPLAFATSPIINTSVHNYRKGDDLTYDVAYCLFYEAGYIFTKANFSCENRSGKSTIFTVGSSHINCLHLYRNNVNGNVFLSVEFWDNDTFEILLGNWQVNTVSSFYVSWELQKENEIQYYVLTATMNDATVTTNCLYFPEFFDKLLVGRYWEDTNYFNGHFLQISAFSDHPPP